MSANVPSKAVNSVAVGSISPVKPQDTNRLSCREQNELWQSIARPATMRWFSLCLNWKIQQTQPKQWTALDMPVPQFRPLAQWSSTTHCKLVGRSLRTKPKFNIQRDSATGACYLCLGKCLQKAILRSTTHPLPADYSSLPTLFLYV